MLSTPLGNIVISVDDTQINYDAISVSRNKACKVVCGRYKIIIDFTPDGHEHQIMCIIDGYEKTDDDHIDTGENL